MLDQCDAYGTIFEMSGAPAAGVLVRLLRVEDAAGHAISLVPTPLITETDASGQYHFTLPQNARAYVTARATTLESCNGGIPLLVPDSDTGELIPTFPVPPGDFGVSPPLTLNNNILSITRSSNTMDGYLAAVDFARFNTAANAPPTPPGGISGDLQLNLAGAFGASRLRQVDNLGTAGSYPFGNRNSVTLLSPLTSNVAGSAYATTFRIMDVDDGAGNAQWFEATPSYGAMNFVWNATGTGQKSREFLINNGRCHITIYGNWRGDVDEGDAIWASSIDDGQYQNGILIQGEKQGPGVTHPPGVHLSAHYPGGPNYNYYFDAVGLNLPGAPVNPLHAATKQYVDSRPAGGVVSFNGRAGAVVPISTDYASFYAASAHTHATFTASVAGFVPAPGTASGTKYLRDDGTWQTVTAGGGVDTAANYAWTGQQTWHVAGGGDQIFIAEGAFTGVSVKAATAADWPGVTVRKPDGSAIGAFQSTPSGSVWGGIPAGSMMMGASSGELWLVSQASQPIKFGFGVPPTAPKASLDSSGVWTCGSITMTPNPIGLSGTYSDGSSAQIILVWTNNYTYIGPYSGPGGGLGGAVVVYRCGTGNEGAGGSVVVTGSAQQWTFYAQIVVQPGYGLFLSRDPASAMEPVTLQYFNAHMPAGGGASPAGTGTELQFRSSASAFGAIPSSQASTDPYGSGLFRTYLPGYLQSTRVGLVTTSGSVGLNVVDGAHTLPDISIFYAVHLSGTQGYVYFGRTGQGGQTPRYMMFYTSLDGLGDLRRFYLAPSGGIHVNEQTLVDNTTAALTISAAGNTAFTYAMQVNGQIYVQGTGLIAIRVTNGAVSMDQNFVPSNLGDLAPKSYVDGVRGARGEMVFIYAGGGNIFPDIGDGSSFFYATLSMNSTLKAVSASGPIITTPANGAKILIKFIQNATGGWTLALDPIYHTGAAGAFNVSTAPNAITYLVAIYHAATAKWHVVGTAFGYA